MMLSPVTVELTLFGLVQINSVSTSIDNVNMTAKCTVEINTKVSGP